MKSKVFPASWGVASLLAALAAPRGARAQGAPCAAVTPGGVVASEGRAAFEGRLAATPGGVAVTWREQRPWRNRDFAGEGRALYFMARAFAPRDLAPRGPAQELFGQGAPYELGLGPSLVTLEAGAIGAVYCTCYGGSASTGCVGVDLVGAGVAALELRPASRQSSTCPQGALAATGVGRDVLAVSPFPDADGVRVYGSAVRALQDVALVGEVQAPAMAALGGDRALYVRRAPDGLEGRVFDVRGNARGAALRLTEPGVSVGAPFALALTSGEVAVAYAQRRGRAPWRVRVSTVRGAAVSHVDVSTGAAPAMAPSLAWGERGCLVLSWTEGSGRTTVARAGRLCNGALEAGSVAQLSRAGVEAGDSEVVSDGRDVYALWQELPGRGAPAELRLARLGCR